MLLQASGIHKSYGTESILTNIYFQIQEKERIGLVGVNGAGKSTLMKILAGVLSPDSGEIHKPKDMVLGYLAQNTGLETERNIWDEMIEVFRHLLDIEHSMRMLEQEISEKAAAGEQEQYEALLKKYDEKAEYFRLHHGYEIEAKVRGMLHGMGFGDIPFDTPIHYLSGGQKTRLALCKLLLQEPDLLMLDEPTNYLDIDTLTWLEDYLRHYPGAILVVSHDRYFLDALVDTIYEIERHQAKRYTGNYSKYLELKQADYEAALKQYEQQQGEIAKLEDFVRKNLARASTTKRAQSRRKALERMERIDRPGGELRKAHFSFEIEKMTGQDVLKVEQLGFGYSDSLLFDHVTFSLKRGEMVALVGPNGTGKSTLLHILTGRYQPVRGSLQWGSNVKLGYYDQEQEDLNLQNTILEELWGAYPHLDELTIRTVLGNFLFSGDDVLKQIKDLSGGEKARVSLAKLMLLKANVLILDEPTNHLDLFSKEILESALMDYEGTVLFISHDRYFLNKMAERVVELSADGVQHFLGNYDDYMEKKRELSELAEPATDNTPSSADRKQETTNYELSKQQKKEERNRQRRIEKLEQDISELEDVIAGIESSLSDPGLASDYMKLQETTDQLEKHKKELEQLYAEWEELCS